MKFLPIVLILSTISAPVFSQEGYGTAAHSALKYSGNIISDNAGDISNSVQDATRAVAKPTKSFLASIWGYISDAGNGIEKQKALATGDGVAINASVYSLALREAERKNEPLNQLKSKRDDTQYALKRSQDEAKRLEELAKAYKEDANNFGRNINTTLQEIASTATRLEGWDKQKQVKLSKLLDEHKKLGEETAKDGDARHASHTLTSLSETFAELETAVLKSPDQAQSIGLGGRLGAMKSLLQGAATRMGEKETQMLQSTRRLNELAQIDDKALAASQEDMQRKMVLGTLNNAVNNLITQAEYSKNRAQIAFSHFDDIEKELGVKGVKPGDLKKHYRDDKNLLALTNTYNNSPIGVYVNSQISKALGSVCELVNNQCKDGTNTNLFNFLDDSSRSIFKDRLITPGSIEVDAGTTDR
ncbi:MAG: hypothetical protein HOP07_16550 [Bacteriovoracaceae bacterium]|nr:hypothetical protein [Bacteriovoracaceae bacterium]